MEFAGILALDMWISYNKNNKNTNKVVTERKEDDALILEFKVCNPAKEKTLSDTAKNALDQIKTMNYASVLESKGIYQDRIRIYGFAFEGKKVWIESSDLNGSLTSHHAYNLI